MGLQPNQFPKISLKAARINAGLSQKDASKMIGVCKSTLQSYEKGDTVPQWDIVDKISRAYGYPADYIFFGRKLALSVDSTPKEQIQNIAENIHFYITSI